MLISPRDHIYLVIEKIQSKLNSYTYPVFIRAKNNRPDLIASSVFIEIKSRYFLVTASHVLNDVLFANSPFCLGLEGSLIAIPEKFKYSIHDEKDHFDIAFCEIGLDFIEAKNINVINESKLMFNRNFETIHISCIHGYPCSKNKQVSALKGSNNFKSYGFTYAGKIDKSFDDWDKYNKNKEIHTYMNYGKVKNINGKIYMPPSPRGISGGGLWLIPNSYSPENIYLEGIFIEYYEKDGVSFSTKIEKVVEFIIFNS